MGMWTVTNSPVSSELQSESLDRSQDGGSVKAGGLGDGHRMFQLKFDLYFALNEQSLAMFSLFFMCIFKYLIKKSMRKSADRNTFAE